MGINPAVTAVLKESDQAKENDHLITLENGIIFQTCKIPPFILQGVEKRIKEPRVPIIEDGGIRIPNPNDPDYIRAYKDYEESRASAYTDALIGLGTKLKYCPDHIPTPESSEWVEEIEFFIGEEIPATGRPRYLAWVKYVAIVSAEDLTRMATKVSAEMGVTEEAVAGAIESFRDSAERNTDTGS